MKRRRNAWRALAKPVPAAVAAPARAAAAGVIAIVIAARDATAARGTERTNAPYGGASQRATSVPRASSQRSAAARVSAPLAFMSSGSGVPVSRSSAALPK